VRNETKLQYCCHISANLLDRGCTRVPRLTQISAPSH